MSQISIGRAINLASVDNASRREPPIVTAARMGQLETASLLASYGADLEVRDGQVNLGSSQTFEKKENLNSKVNIYKIKIRLFFFSYMGLKIVSLFEPKGYF